MKNMLKYVLFLFLHFSAVSLFAADTATLRGTVKDAATNEPLQNANIILSGSNLGAAADESGQFVIENIPPGVYALRATRIGYEPFVVKDIQLTAGTNKTVDIQLTQGMINMRDVRVEADKFHSRYRDIELSGSQSLEPRYVSKMAGSLDDITRAVQMFGGAVPAGDYTSFYAVRGGSPDQNIVMLDGLVVPNPYRLRLVMGGGVSIFNEYTTRDVELYTSNFPVEYGNFLSSAMNVTSRDGRTDHFGYGGSVNFLEANAYVEGPWSNKKGSWLFSARRSYFDLLAERFDKEQNSYPSAFDLESKLTYTMTDQLKFSFKTLISHEGTDMGSLDDKELGLEEKSDINLYSMTVDYLPTEKSYEKINVAYYDEKFDYQVYKNTKRPIDLFGDYETRIKTFTIKEDYKYMITPNHSISRGMQFLLDNSSMDLATKVVSTAFARRDVPPIVEYENESGHFDTYLDYSGRIMPWLQVKLGVRADYSFLIDKGDISPRGTIIVNATDKLSFSLYKGICHQYPNVFSVFDRDWPLNIASNLNISSEKADHTVFGVTKLWGSNYLTRVEAYYKDIDSLLVPANRVNYTPQNWGEAYALGIELLVEKGENPNSRWNGMISYAYSKSEYRYTDLDWYGDYYSRPNYFKTINSWIPFNFDRRHSVTAFGNVKLSKKLSVSSTWRYGSGLPHNTITAYVNAGVEGSQFTKTTDNALRFPCYQRIDIRFNYETHTSRGIFNMYLDLTNILNRKNIYDQAWYVNTEFLNPESNENEYEDSYQQELIQRNIYMLPFIPSLGISFNFE